MYIYYICVLYVCLCVRIHCDTVAPPRPQRIAQRGAGPTAQPLRPRQQRERRQVQERSQPAKHKMDHLQKI